VEALLPVTLYFPHFKLPQVLGDAVGFASITAYVQEKSWGEALFFPTVFSSFFMLKHTLVFILFLFEEPPLTIL
jgi:hypothetical protein